jgi:hypothetical protein
MEKLFLTTLARAAQEESRKIESLLLASTSAAAFGARTKRDVDVT